MADHYVAFAGADLTTLPVRIDAIFRTQAEANTYATANTGISALAGAITEDNVDVGWWITGASPVTVSENYPQTAASRKAIVKALAVAHGNRVWDHMRPGWVMGDGGVAFVSASPPVSQRRYRNTYYWIMSGVGAVATACDDTGWTAAQCEQALAALQSLIPDDPVSIHMWYGAHTEAIWTAYFTVANNAVPGYFHWQRGNAIPAFASDAASSTLWNGASGSEKPTFTVTVNATPGSFA